MTDPGGRFLPYGRHQIDEDDIAAVASVVRSDSLTGGPLGRNHGMFCEAARFFPRDEAFDADGQPKPWLCEIPEPGCNYCASVIHCALGLSELRGLDRFLAPRMPHKVVGIRPKEKLREVMRPRTTPVTFWVCPSAS
jgi:dTDP-4-amino-4,6-dideoxygalactose transaminase